MCYYVSKPEKKKIADFLSKSDIDITDWDWDGYFPANIESGFAHQLLAVTTAETPHVVDTAIWGLVPYWAKTAETAKEMADMTLNAVGEEIYQKASYKSYIGSNRCLIWVDGFFEWQHLEYKVPGKGSRMRTEKEKRPHFIYMPEQKPFALGGVYSEFVRPDTGQVFKTVSIITTAANKLMAEIHNNKKRMPFVVPQQNWKQWMSDMKQEEIQNMIQPLKDDMLQAHPIAKIDPRNLAAFNYPEVKNKVDYPPVSLF